MSSTLSGAALTGGLSRGQDRADELSGDDHDRGHRSGHQVAAIHPFSARSMERAIRFSAITPATPRV